MAICDKRTLQPGGEEPCDKETLNPGGKPNVPTGDPFNPEPPINPGLPGGPNTPIIEEVDWKFGTKYPLGPGNPINQVPGGSGPNRDSPTNSNGGGCCPFVEENDPRIDPESEVYDPRLVALLEKCKEDEETSEDAEDDLTEEELEEITRDNVEPLAGTEGRGKEDFDHSVNCVGPNGNELWNINDGVQYNDCYVPEEYDKVIFEPRQNVFCRDVDFGSKVRLWGDVFIGDILELQELIPDRSEGSGQGGADGADEVEPEEDEGAGEGNLYVLGDSLFFDDSYFKEDVLIEGQLETTQPIVVAGVLFKPKTITYVTSVNFGSQTTTTETITVLAAG